MIIGRDISVVIPVLNEKENIDPLLHEFDSVVTDHGLNQIQEIIFVDDGSSDGTVDAIRRNSGRHAFSVKVVERTTKLGTVNATIAGCKVANSDALIVMDADLQHPPCVILEMARRMHEGQDLIVASRHVHGGRNVWKPLRGVISRVAIFISYILIPSARNIKDPTSGFFMAKKDLLVNLPPLKKRAKILLYVLAASQAAKALEIPYTFVDRKNGKSKIVGLNSSFVLNYLIEVLGYMKLARRRGLPSSKASSISTPNIHE